MDEYTLWVNSVPTKLPIHVNPTSEQDGIIILTQQVPEVYPIVEQDIRKIAGNLSQKVFVLDLTNYVKSFVEATGMLPPVYDNPTPQHVEHWQNILYVFFNNAEDIQSRKRFIGALIAAIYKLPTSIPLEFVFDRYFPIIGQDELNYIANIFRTVKPSTALNLLKTLGLSASDEHSASELVRTLAVPRT